MKFFDEISNENMVLFYREEVEMIDRGSKMRDLIPKPVRFRRARKTGGIHTPYITFKEVTFNPSSSLIPRGIR